MSGAVAGWRHKDKRGKFLCSDPWRAENDDSCGYSSVAVHDAQGRVVALVVADGDGGSILEERAALIASAPTLLAENAALRASNAEMLAALRAVLPIVKAAAHRERNMENARKLKAQADNAAAAIARATEAAS